MTAISLIKRDIVSTRSVRAVCGDGLPPLERLEPELFAEADRVCLVTDRACLKLFGKEFRRMLGGRARAAGTFLLPAGGRAKTFGRLEKLLDLLLKRGFSRKSLLVAAGGGAVTDLAGLAAALYMRGIKWISVPTTLLGQIDAGLGGKTAVDLRGVKNAAGAFYQPELAVCETGFLRTLGPAELKAGAGELMKYALIGPEPLRKTVDMNLGAALKGGAAALGALTAACADYKLSLVARDERDESGLREELNFGHTAGHAFEALSKGRLPHGLAVLWGLRYACLLSARLGKLEPEHADELRDFLWGVEAPPLSGACFSFKAFHELVCHDKKAGAHGNRFLLIERPGRLAAVNDVKPADLRAALEELRKSI